MVKEKKNGKGVALLKFRKEEKEERGKLARAGELVKRAKQQKFLANLAKGRFTPTEASKVRDELKKERRAALQIEKFRSVSNFARQKAKLQRDAKLQRIKNKIERKKQIGVAKAERAVKNIKQPVSFAKSLGFGDSSGGGGRGFTGNGFTGNGFESNGFDSGFNGGGHLDFDFGFGGSAPRRRRKKRR